MMNVVEAIRTKRAVRQFQDQPLPDEVVLAILDAGRRAQSSKNTQPWHFMVIRDRAILQQLASLGPFAGHLAGAALGVALLTPPPEERYTIMFDAGQAAAYLQLAAWELGVASCLGSIYEGEQARAILGFPPELHLRMTISFGYVLPGDGAPPPPKKGGRRALDEVVHWDKW
jgi:nitroreductase